MHRAVRQEKLGKDNQVELNEESSYAYLVILSNTGGELNLSESRIPIHAAKSGSCRIHESREPQILLALLKCGR